MADNVTLPGTGSAIACDEAVDGTLGTVKFQYVKLVDGTLDSTTKVAATANGLKVDGSAVTQPVSGTFWQATQPVSGTVSATPAAATTGGATPYSYLAAASTNQDSQIVKASAGQLYSLLAVNMNASLRYLKLYDKATGPTSADTPKFRIPLPASTTGAGAAWSIAIGAAFASGISFRITTGIADNDTGAATANDVAINMVTK